MPVFQFLKRQWLLNKPLPASWQQVLDKKVRVYSRLPENLKTTLKERMIIFMNEKLFEGCGGLIMTEEKKIIISAYACVLILGEKSDYFPDLRAILVYPDEYVAPVHDEDEGGIITHGTEARKGEYWSAGSIVLSWNDIKDNISGKSPGQNLIYHEFSHQLDYRYGLTAGIDEQGNVHRQDEWTETLARYYRKLRQRSFGNMSTVIDNYGATNPAEFFSVATEAFFEKPVRLQRDLPELYALLKSFYKLDPVNWKLHF